jgi:uncharacterized protein (TIGR00106 family)
MPVVLADITVLPIGTGNTSISDYIAASEALLKEFPELKHRVNPLSTSVEGELDRVLELVRRMHEAPFAEGAYRVSTSLRIDDRRDSSVSMEHPMDAVREKAGLR